jgi:cytochrome c oxidase subunit IV
MANFHHGAHEEYKEGSIPPPQTKHIWRVFLILVAITAVEFGFAFLMDAGTARNVIFILLTLLKAFYIVSEFMHLKHETKSLIWSILVPTALLVWLVIALITEGSYIHEMIFSYFE